MNTDDIRYFSSSQYHSKPRLLKNATINIGLLTVVFTSLKKHHIDFLSDRNSKKVTIEANTYPKNQSQNDLVDI